MKTIAIVSGGNSSEFGISVKSAAAVSRAIAAMYHSYIIMIKGSEWYWEEPSGQVYKVDKNNFTIKLPDRHIRFDAAFIAIHGSPGEDGLLQAYFEMIGLPYTGCNTFTSALTFNKNACKSFLRDHAVKMARSVMISRDNIPDPGTLAGKIGLPMFIKPNESGSSFGVSKVSRTAEIMPAIELALTESAEVLAEEFMDGTEVACGVIRTSGETIILPLTEIVSKNVFFDFEAKYDPSKADEITPARLPDNITAAVQKAGADISSYLGCRGLVRLDFIIVGDEPMFIELNTIPGITEESIVPKQMDEYGIRPGELYSKLIEDAVKTGQ